MTVLLLRRRDIVCQQTVELVTDYLEGALCPVGIDGDSRLI